MDNIKAQIIPKPKEGTRTVFLGKDLKGKPFIKGNGFTSYVCGNCNYLLIKNIIYGQVRNIIFQCPNCGKFNEV